MLNSCSFIGNVGSDPEVKTVGENQVATFSIGCSEKWKDRDGNIQSKTEWIRCVAWRQLAGIIEKYVKKGSQVYVEGRMETRSYDKDGAKHYTTEIVLNTLKMLGKKDGESQTEAPAANHAPSASGDAIQAPPSKAEPAKPMFKDDLPF